MMFPPPHLIPKLRSPACREACAEMPCTLRISNFIPGHGCSDRSTVVGCHGEGPDKGMSTKTTDVGIAAGCKHCHDLLDRRDSRWKYLEEHYAAAVADRIHKANKETLGYLLMMGKIIVPDGELV